MDHARPLRTTLHALLDSDPSANPAFHRLFRDYVDYHWVFVVLGGIMTLLLVALSVVLWARFRRAPRASAGRRTYLRLALPASFVTLVMVVALAANVSTVANPRPGFAHVIDALPAAPAGSREARLERSYHAWVRSGDPDLPPRIQAAVDARLAWQRPKAIICAVLLLGAAPAAFGIWRAFLRRSPKRRRTLAVMGSLVSLATVVLMVMVLGNAEAAVAPIALTLLYG